MKKLLILIPLMALALAGCGKEEEQEKKLPERFVEVSRGEGESDGSTDIHALQDKETGCQYILVRRPSGGTAMSPILKPNGKPYCVQAKHEKTGTN